MKRTILCAENGATKNTGSNEINTLKCQLETVSTLEERGRGEVEQCASRPVRMPVAVCCGGGWGGGTCSSRSIRRIHPHVVFVCTQSLVYRSHALSPVHTVSCSMKIHIHRTQLCIRIHIYFKICLKLVSLFSSPIMFTSISFYSLRFLPLFDRRKIHSGGEWTW